MLIQDYNFPTGMDNLKSVALSGSRIQLAHVALVLEQRMGGQQSVC